MSTTIKFIQKKMLYEDGVWICLKPSSPEDAARARRFCSKPNEECDAEIDKHRDKRSGEANRYCWKLISKIAEALTPPLTKDEVYFNMLKKYGQTGVVKVPNEDVERFKRQFVYVEEHEKLAPEDRAKYLRFWVGSSHYNTREMYLFIQGIISDAQELDIDTRTPDEIALMMERYKSED